MLPKSYIEGHGLASAYRQEAMSLVGIPFRSRQKTSRGMDCTNLADYLNRDFTGYPAELDIGYYSIGHAAESKESLLEPSLHASKGLECIWSRTGEWKEGKAGDTLDNLQMKTGDMLVLVPGKHRRVAHHLSIFLEYLFNNKDCPRYIHAVPFAGVIIEDCLPQGFTVSSVWRVKFIEGRVPPTPLEKASPLGASEKGRATPSSLEVRTLS